MTAGKEDMLLQGSIGNLRQPYVLFLTCFVFREKIAFTGKTVRNGNCNNMYDNLWYQSRPWLILMSDQRCVCV